MFTVYLSLGSNMGDKYLNLTKAIDEISLKIGEIRNKSSWYASEAWGVNNQEDYLNIVLEVSTPYFPFKLIDILLQIEKDLGRIRNNKWESRTVDIDILFYENFVFSTNSLIIPHKYLAFRKFVLMPLAEIASDYIHPQNRKTITQLLAECEDSLWVKPVNYTATGALMPG